MEELQEFSISCSYNVVVHTNVQGRNEYSFFYRVLPSVATKDQYLYWRNKKNESQKYHNF